jgi:hypothetical protein
MSEPQLVVVEATATHTIGLWRNFAVVIWRRETVPEGLTALQTKLGELSRQHPKNVCLMQVIESTGTAPETEVRTALAQLLTSFHEHIVSSSIVFEEAGFRAAVVRAVVTGVTLLARFGFPHVVFSAVGEAAVWHARLAKKGEVRASELVEAVEALRHAALSPNRS